MEELDLIIKVDPSQDKVLGVFGSEVHLKTTAFKVDEEDPLGHEAVVVLVPQEEYLRLWTNWLKGKKRICESYNEYCGVLGEFDVEEIEELKQKTTLYDWEDDGTDEGKDVWYKARTFRVTKFDDRPDFEHG